MAMLPMVDYDDPSAEVRAVFDDIMTAEESFAALPGSDVTLKLRGGAETAAVESMAAAIGAAFREQADSNP